MPVYRNIHTGNVQVVEGNLIGDYEQAPNWERLPDLPEAPAGKPKPGEAKKK